MDFSESEEEDYPSSPLYEEEDYTPNEDYDEEERPSSPLYDNQDDDTGRENLECFCGKALLNTHECFATNGCISPTLLYSKDCPCNKHKAIREL